MTALAGLISSRPRPDGERVVRAMLARMTRPQGIVEVHSTERVTLGCLRNSTTPACLCHTDGAFAICKGDVMNHKDLRAISPDHVFRSDTPAESITAAFAARGLDSMKQHNGPCVLAFHDQRQGVTHIVRDRYGEMTLHYCIGPDYLAFATEIKALLELVTPRFNEAALSYKAFEFCVGQETLFRDIYAVEPGNALVIQDDGRHLLQVWWRIWDYLLPVPSSPEQAVEDVVDLLEDSVRLRTRHNGSSACLLSGGIDSSLVACMTNPDTLYHAHYDFADFNELEYAQCVAQHMGKELRVVTPQKKDFLNYGEAILHTLDSPCTWTSFTQWMLAQQIHADGIHYIYTGDGADELFGGYHRYHLLYHDEQIHHMEAMQQYTYLIEKYYGSRVDRYAKLINRNDNIYDTSVNNYIKNILRNYDAVSHGDVVNFMTLTDFYTTSQVLLYMSDRIYSHFDIISRSPFMDYRLVQMAFSLGTSFKINDGVTKWLLRKVAQRYLPASVLGRMDKRGFSAPVNRWFQWDTPGRYSRDGYRSCVLEQWRRVFAVEG